ncbi:MAG: RNA methyltransferase, partial [Thermoproteota archaeon]
RLTIQFKKGYPDFEIKEIAKENVPKYWGYKVKERKNLSEFLSSWDGNIILTSRKGKSITETSLEKFVDQKPLLVVFGSPQRGLYDLLGPNIKNIQNSKILNFFPQQATETVRLEEALLGTLSILNIMRLGYI